MSKGDAAELTAFGVSLQTQSAHYSGTNLAASRDPPVATPMIVSQARAIMSSATPASAAYCDSVSTLANDRFSTNQNKKLSGCTISYIMQARIYFPTRPRFA
jgi:hypothetical protein